MVDADRPVGEVIDDVVGRIVAFVSGGTIVGDVSGQAKGVAAPAEGTQAPVPPPAPVDELVASIGQPTIVDNPSVAGS